MKAGVDKATFIAKLSELLKMTRLDVDHLELKDEDTVVIHYYVGPLTPMNGYQRSVSIAGDSGLAIVKDEIDRI